MKYSKSWSVRGSCSDPGRHRGVALITGLLLLASLVLLALAIATGMVLERRMAGNFADEQLALRRARLAGKWATYWLQSRANNPLDANCEENCGPSPPIFEGGGLPVYPELEDSAWWRVNGAVAGVEPTTGNTEMDYTLAGIDSPMWVAEQFYTQPLTGYEPSAGDSEPSIAYYRVLARGSGRFPGSVAVTETILARPWAEPFVPSPYPPQPGALWFCEQVDEDIPCGPMGWRRRR